MGMIVTSTGFVSSLLHGNQRGDSLGDSARRDAVARAGGSIVAEGTPEQIGQNGESYTGQFLKEKLQR